MSSEGGAALSMLQQAVQANFDQLHRALCEEIETASVPNRFQVLYENLIPGHCHSSTLSAADIDKLAEDFQFLYSLYMTQEPLSSHLNVSSLHEATCEISNGNCREQNESSVAIVNNWERYAMGRKDIQTEASPRPMPTKSHNRTDGCSSLMPHMKKEPFDQDYVTVACIERNVDDSKLISVHPEPTDDDFDILFTSADHQPVPVHQLGYEDIRVKKERVREVDKQPSFSRLQSLSSSSPAIVFKKLRDVQKRELSHSRFFQTECNGQLHADDPFYKECDPLLPAAISASLPTDKENYPPIRDLPVSSGMLQEDAYIAITKDGMTGVSTESHHLTKSLRRLSSAAVRYHFSDEEDESSVPVSYYHEDIHSDDNNSSDSDSERDFHGNEVQGGMAMKVIYYHHYMTIRSKYSRRLDVELLWQLRLIDKKTSRQVTNDIFEGIPLKRPRGRPRVDKALWLQGRIRKRSGYVQSHCALFLRRNRRQVRKRRRMVTALSSTPLTRDRQYGTSDKVEDAAREFGPQRIEQQDSLPMDVSTTSSSLLERDHLVHVLFPADHKQIENSEPVAGVKATMKNILDSDALFQPFRKNVSGILIEESLY